MSSLPIYLVSVTPPEDPEIIHLPMLQTHWLHPDADLTAVNGIIFTSKNGVEAMERIDPAWKTLPLVCVGTATSRYARTLGAEHIETGDGYGAGLTQRLRAHPHGFRWLYARPKVVASDFAAQLRREGFLIDEAVVYETVCAPGDDNAVPAAPAVLIFTSPSALACFRSRYALQPGHTVVVIGKTTRNSIPDHPVYVASEPTVSACVALAKKLAKEIS